MLERLCYTQSMKRNRRTPDVNVIAARIVKQATDEAHIVKNPAAVALGRLGGLKGGRARAEKLTPEKRQEIAQKAARTRWQKTKPTVVTPVE